MIMVNRDMPESCRYCPLCRHYPSNGTTWCNDKNRLISTNWNLDPLNTKPDWCELINVPDMNVGNSSEIPNSSTDCISRQAAVDSLDGEITVTGEDNAKAVRKYIRDVSEKIRNMPSVQQEPCDDPRADVYYLAEKIGIHQLYALVVALRGEPELISEHSVWFRISETLVDESKGHITPEQAIRKIREYLRMMEKPERKKGRCLTDGGRNREMEREFENTLQKDLPEYKYSAEHEHVR